MNTQPEALRLADALDAEFVQGRISNSTGRESAVELRRLHEVNQDLLKALHEPLETEQKTAVSPGKGTGFIDARALGITVLRQALVDADDTSQKRVDEMVKTEHEPVAWLKTWSDGSLSVLKTKSHAFADHELEPLYAAPPKKEWVGLTEEEIYDCEEEVGMPQYEISSADLYAFAQAIEAKLREKNGGEYRNGATT